jgi:hypothetical protein
VLSGTSRISGTYFGISLFLLLPNSLWIYLPRFGLKLLPSIPVLEFYQKALACLLGPALQA